MDRVHPGVSMKSGRKKLRASQNEFAGTGSSKKKRKSSENDYITEVLELKSTIENWDNLFSEEAEESRMSDWLRISILGEPLLRKYAWVRVLFLLISKCLFGGIAQAIPDNRALNVLAQFSPIVEIGSVILITH